MKGESGCWFKITGRAFVAAQSIALHNGGAAQLYDQRLLCRR